MRRSKLMVALAATIPPTQVAQKRRNIATETGMAEQDIVIIDGATSLTLLPPEPETDTVDLIRGLLEANNSRLKQGNFQDVATDIAWALQQPG